MIGKGESPGVIIGVVLVVLMIMSIVGTGWRFWQMWTSRALKNPKVIPLDNDNNNHDGITPYPLPGTIEVEEQRSRRWMKRGAHRGGVQNEENNNPPTQRSIGRLRMTDSRTGARFRQTDSGWRLAFGSATSQPSEARSALEMPPTYSEAV
ncbi:hypothetical protein PM082_015005 [Marasmius tenuissimus]|nr:hypothetical protein PM082_015005 [Marasmius tenuissimus]